MAISLMVSSLLFISGHISATPPSVNTPLGTVIGITDEDCDAYLGIPYAKPPIRWRPPEKLEEFLDEPLMADAWKPMCYQTACTDPTGVCNGALAHIEFGIRCNPTKGKRRNKVMCIETEPILDLCENENSFTATAIDINECIYSKHETADTDTRALSRPPCWQLCYTYTGAVFHGGKLSKKGDIIVVTINYRLDVFQGLFTGTTAEDANGNYSILDQKEAIKWVHEYISSFGGNPDKVTLSGQSAGAQSVMLHMIDEEVDDMFTQVILQSVPVSIPFRPQGEAIAQGALFAAELGCNKADIDCMRSKSPRDVIEASARLPNHFSSILTQFEPWLPVENGIKVPRYFEIAYNPSTTTEQSPRFTKPIILGTIEHEAITYIYEGFEEELSAGEYFLLLIEIKQFQSFALYFNYPPDTFFDSRKALSELATDFIFKCPTRMLANQMHANTNVWLYSMEQGFERDVIWTGSGNCENVACHGEDVPYLFQTFERGGYNLTASEKNISESILYYFTNFVKTGNPNIGETPNVPIWHKYIDTPTERKNIVFKSGKTQVIPFSKHYLCNMWDLFSPYTA
ncbi:hypothetical protein ScPMuIL_015221 [Solemya velum]